MSIENNIKKLILDRYKSMRRFSEISKLPYTTLVGMLDRGITNASIQNVIKICQTLNIDADALAAGVIKEKPASEIIASSSDEKLLKKYHSLDDYGKEAVNNILEVEYSRCNVVEEPMPAYLPKTYYSISASAGNGEMLFDDLEQSTIMVPQTSESERADFVLQVNGDSMLPDFKDGDKVLVKKQDSIEIGEIGIFIVNCESFIKKLGQSELISLNKKYKPIPLRESDSVSCVGKVIGKV